jgi:hypothetical protein
MRSLKPVRLSVVIILVFFAGPAAARDDEPEGAKRFKKTLEAKAKTVLRVAHPLAKYKDARFDSYKKTDKGHELTYTIDWTGKDDTDFSTTLTFTFTLKNDEIDELTITTKDATAFKGPNAVVAVFRTQVMKKLKEITDDKDLFEKVEKMDADNLLAVWLKYADRKAKP